MALDDPGARMPRGPLAFTVKVTLIAGLAAIALAHHLARPVEPRTQLARGPGEPEVTGSIGGRAAATRLDPCALR